MTTFESLGLASPILRALEAIRFHVPTPVQQQAIPYLLEGRDIMAIAQTGTGKTAAFAIPTLQKLLSRSDKRKGARGVRRTRRPGIRALILAPTRELAHQIGEHFEQLGKFTHLRQTVVFGGVRQGPQTRALTAGVDILVATPGRLLDLIGQGFVRLDAVEALTLDEADRMLDMGFIHDLRKIVAHVPRARQTLMFSATMPPAVGELAGHWLRKPVRIQVTPPAATPDKVTQSVCFVERGQKPQLLARFLGQTACKRTLVFTRTKRRADKVARSLKVAGIRAVSIHGDKSQGARLAAMGQFKGAEPPVLVATDVAARGLDVSDVSHVVNYDLPDQPEMYIHRIGRTARAGSAGCAISFCSGDERPQLKLIEKYTGRALSVDGISRGSARASLPTSVLPTSEDTARSSCGRSRPANAASSGASRSPKKRRRTRRSSGSYRN